MSLFEYNNKVIIYYLPEELDQYAADMYKRKSEYVFNEKKVDIVIFDFEKTRFMNSSGIGLITGRYRKICENFGRVYSINVNSDINKILTLSGVYRIMQNKSDKQEIIGELIKEGYYE